MKLKAITLATLLLCFALAQQTAKAPAVRKLLSVTYNVAEGKLTWSVAEGYRDDKGEFQPDRLLDVAEIDPDAATMKIGDEVRRFSPREAVALQKMLDILAAYCAESSAWWDAGEGEPVKKGAVARRDHMLGMLAARQP